MSVPDGQQVERTKETTTAEQESKKICIYNGIPNFPENFVFDGHFVIAERIGWDDSVGATYFVLPVKADRPMELVLRLDNVRVHPRSVLKTELELLQKADNLNRHQWFSQVHDHGCVNGEFLWYTCFFRGGPSLRQICDFMIQSRGHYRFSAGSVGRFAEDLFNISSFVHQQQFLLGGMNQELFHFDAVSRKLFLADLSNVQKVEDLAKTPYRWHGSLDYTPIAFSEEVEVEGTHQKANCELEAVIYLVLELAGGGLAWNSSSRSEVIRLKLEALNSSRKAYAMEDEYLKLCGLVAQIVSSEEVYTDIAPIIGQCRAIYQDIGGVNDWDLDFDFERQPRPDELPQFVVEKVPKEMEEEKEADASTIGNNH